MSEISTNSNNSDTNKQLLDSQAYGLPGFFYSTGIYRHHVAGRIFMEAVFMAAEDLSRLENISHNIYEPIAKCHGLGVSRVSKNVRDVRTTIMKHGGAELLAEMTGSGHWGLELPYPHEIIEVFARYIRKHKIPRDVL